MNMNAEIFNTALAMVLEWGPNFGKPIQERLRHAYPTLSEPEADAYDTLCREVKSYALGEIERAYLKQIPDAEAHANILRNYPLVNADNMAHLNTQGYYYAWHDNR